MPPLSGSMIVEAFVYDQLIEDITTGNTGYFSYLLTEFYDPDVNAVTALQYKASVLKNCSVQGIVLYLTPGPSLIEDYVRHLCIL